jgi:hypothetical protein
MKTLLLLCLLVSTNAFAGTGFSANDSVVRISISKLVEYSGRMKLTGDSSASETLPDLLTEYIIGYKDDQLNKSCDVNADGKVMECKLGVYHAGPMAFEEILSYSMKVKVDSNSNVQVLRPASYVVEVARPGNPR